MNGYARLMGVGIVAVVALVAMSADASADYRVSVWQNDTDCNVGGSYRWGSGPWKPFWIGPGGNAWTADNRINGDRRLSIRFDADPGPGEDWVFYDLQTYISPTTVFNNGPTEVFHFRSDGRIELSKTRW